MKTSDFYYDLPKELIAQTPLSNRSDSKLMILNRKDNKIEHKHFSDIIDYLDEGDCLVLNNTKVIPARLIGVRKDTGATVEILLLKRISNNSDLKVDLFEINESENCWECLVKPGKKARIGHEIVFGDGILEAKIIDVKDDGNRIISFSYDGIFEEILDRLGTIPLPPYITTQLDDSDRYQTVYAKYKGSAAAPTAGLHFTEDLLEKISKKGIKIAYVTLHVGLGTFRPVKVDNVHEHKMHSEYYSIDKINADIINSTKENNKRIIAVGTTSCRTLESVADDNGLITEKKGSTDIFIYPGYDFKIVDSLITNFHLPESTLMMLISAFYEKDKILSAYNEAINKKYRFFSFGDAMFIQ